MLYIVKIFDNKITQEYVYNNQEKDEAYNTYLWANHAELMTCQNRKINLIEKK